MLAPAEHGGALPVARGPALGSGRRARVPPRVSGGSSTPIPATGWRSARRGWPMTSGWRATSARTSSTSRSTSSSSKRRGAPDVPRRDRSSLDAMARSGAPCTWVLGNHDVDRPVTRYGGGAVGVARARAAALVQLSLPGAAYLYNGDELGLPNVDLPDWRLQDPTWERSGHTERGRDGERVPLPWSGDRRRSGSARRHRRGCRCPRSGPRLTVEAQEADPASTLSLYRAALSLRAAARPARHAFEWLDAPADCLAYRRGEVIVLLNAGTGRSPLPPGEVLLCSGPLDRRITLPPNTAGWCSALRLATEGSEGRAGAFGVHGAVLGRHPDPPPATSTVTVRPARQEAHPGQGAEGAQADLGRRGRRRRRCSTTESSRASATSARGWAPGTPSRSAASFSASAPVRTSGRTTSSGTVSTRCQPAPAAAPLRHRASRAVGGSAALAVEPGRAARRHATVMSSRRRPWSTVIVRAASTSNGRRTSADDAVAAAPEPGQAGRVERRPRAAAAEPGSATSSARAPRHASRHVVAKPARIARPRR